MLRRWWLKFWWRLFGIPEDGRCHHHFSRDKDGNCIACGEPQRVEDPDAFVSVLDRDPSKEKISG